MTALVVGGDGLIGGGVARALPRCIATTRRQSSNALFLDLLGPPSELPSVEVAFLCAGINGFRECGGNQIAWRTNVDGVVQVARMLARANAFIVYVSSAAVEWSGEMYARQRAHVECALQGFCDPAIIRPERVNRDNVEAFAAAAVAIGIDRRAGVHHWP